MSPIELYHFRCLTKFLYTNIIIDDIYNKIISNVKTRLQYEFGDNYNSIINIIKDRNICIYGPIITEAIWHEYHDNTYIDLKLLDINMGIKDNNVFIDFKKIFSDINEYLYDESDDWFSHSSDTSTFINNKIRLYIISDECSKYDSDSYETFPTIFQNRIIIGDDWNLTIKDIKAVMNKTYIPSDYYHSYDKLEQETEEELCNKYNLKRL